MKTKGSHAFTLLELLVALGLTAVIVGFALAVSDRMLVAWSRQNSLLAGRATACVIFDQLARDLQSSLSAEDGRVWFAATILDDSGNSGMWESAPREKPHGAGAGSLRLDAPSVREDRFGQAGVWLRFFTAGGRIQSAIPGEAEEAFSEPAAVAYQLVRRRLDETAANGAGRYLLYRTEVRSAALAGRPGPLEAGFDLDSDNGSSAYAQAGEGNDGMRLGDPFAITRPGNRDHVLAEDVVDFGLRLYRRTEKGELAVMFPISGHDTVHLATKASSPRGSSEAMFPVAVEMMLRILSDEGVRQLAAMESAAGEKMPRPARFGNDADWWWSVVTANSEVFTCWINLPGREG